MSTVAYREVRRAGGEKFEGLKKIRKILKRKKKFRKNSRKILKSRRAERLKRV